MGSISTKAVQNVDNKFEEVIADALRNPIVLRKILEHFSSYQLLQLSFVSKSWMNAARCVIRKRADFIAACCSDNDQNDDLVAFGTDLRHMKVVPFCGIRVRMYAYKHEKERSAAALYAANVIFEKLSWKALSVTLTCGSWSKQNDTPAFLLVQRVLEDHHRILEKLTLYVRWEQAEFLENVIRDLTFPRLKTLALNYGDKTLEEPYTNYVKALVSRAPNLQELRVDEEINLMENLVKGRDAIIVCTSYVKAPFDYISEDVIGALRLEQVELQYTGPEFNFERFNRITPMLLQMCCTSTLDSMWLDAVLAVPLMCYGISLPNVDHLNMDMNYNELDWNEPWILEIVKEFDFTLIFPKLHKVRIFSSSRPELSPDHLDVMFEEANAVLWEPLPDRADSINELELSASLYSNNVPFYYQMFPSIRKLKVNSAFATDTPYREFRLTLYESIWAHWTELTELKVKNNDLRGIPNIDSIFCGIFPEEAAELRQMDEEYLKAVNIVPVMPAITCLKELRTFHIDYAFINGFITNDTTRVLSKVTGLIAFARCPSLAVTLKTHCKEAYDVLAHMIPYATLILKQRN